MTHTSLDLCDRSSRFVRLNTERFVSKSVSKFSACNSLKPFEEYSTVREAPERARLPELRIGLARRPRPFPTRPRLSTWSASLSQRIQVQRCGARVFRRRPRLL